MSRLMTSVIWEINWRIIDGLQIGKGSFIFHAELGRIQLFTQCLCCLMLVLLVFVLGKTWVSIQTFRECLGILNEGVGRMEFQYASPSTVTSYDSL